MLNFEKYDLIISSSSSFAKAVKKRPGAQHICFCHNVTRFLWDTQTYLHGYREFEAVGFIVRPILKFMRKMDLAYADEPDVYIANSTTVSKRITNIYGKRVMTLNYPINDDCFTFCDRKENFHLVSSRFISYKRIDIIIDAFNRLGWPLLIIGDGPERERLEKKAAGNIRFLGHVSDEQRRHLFSKAKAVVVAALEDYGLVPIEANFSGTPVIAYGAGGALDTQVPRKTGLFFESQSAQALEGALKTSQSFRWDYAAIERHARQRFTRSAFFEKVDRLIASLYIEADSTAASPIPKAIASYSSRAS